MIPTTYITNPILPTTPNGKNNPNALATLTPPPATSPQHTEPTTPAETALAAIWAHLLRLPHINTDDNFFTLGGDPIPSLQVVARARQTGWIIQPKHTFEHQTLRELAAAAQPAHHTTPTHQGPITG